MPTYEFRCPNGHLFDRFYSRISEAATDVPCPTCGKQAHVQISGGAGLVFKGSGFYLTDYGKNAHRGNAPKSSESKGGEPKSGESGGGESRSRDAKPASEGSSKSLDSGSAAPPASKPEKSPGSAGSDKKPSGGSAT